MNQQFPPSRHLYSSDGHWVAFLVGEDIFWRDGERLGWFQSFGADQQDMAPPSGEHHATWSGGIVKTRSGKQVAIVTESSIIVLEAQASSAPEPCERL